MPQEAAGRPRTGLRIPRCAKPANDGPDRRLVPVEEGMANRLAPLVQTLQTAFGELAKRASCLAG